MNKTELRDLLYQEHRRDLRLMLIGYGIYVAMAIIILGVLYAFAKNMLLAMINNASEGMSELSASNPYYSIIFPLIAVSMIGYLVMKILKVIKRPQQIEKLISTLDTDAKAGQITEHVEYKIIIWLIKLKINLAPVNYVNIIFTGSKHSTFSLPFPKEYVAELKTLLSGISESEVLSKKEELYDDNINETEEKTILPSNAEFAKFVDTDLAKDIEDSKEKIKSTGGYWKKAILPILGVIIVFVLILKFAFADTMSNTSLIIVVAVILGSFAYSIFMMKNNKNLNPMAMASGVDEHFKSNILEKLVKFINPNSTYIRLGHLKLEEVLETGFFEINRYDISGNDHIISRHSGVSFQMSDIDMSYMPQFSKENREPDTVFYGQVFVAKFNKELKDDIYVVSRAAEGFFTSNVDSTYFRHLGKEIKLEDPDFAKKFKVYAGDDIEARYILSTSMMQRIKTISEKSNNKDIMLSFRNNRLSLLNFSKGDSFELDINGKKDIREQIIDIFDDLKSILEIIDELKLNINIWKS